MTDILLEDVHYLPTTGGIGNYIQWRCVKGYTAPTALGTEQLPPRPHLAGRRVALPLGRVAIDSN